MANNDVILKDYNTTPLSFNPDVLDVGGTVRRNRYALANAASYVKSFTGALTSSWQKVASCDINTRALRVGFPANTQIYDVEWTFVPTGATAPTETLGDCLLAGGFFDAIPIGDIYMRSASGQSVLVKTAS